MKTIELFAGTKSFSKVMSEYGHQTLTIDNDESLDPDMCIDIAHPDLLMDDEFDVNFDILWASPPCQGFSVAVIGRNWNYDRTPKTDSARLAMELAQKTVSIIEATKPKWWFIENPRSMLRKMDFMEEFLKRAGGGPTHHLLLPVWRHAPEAHRYLDECDLVETKADVRERFTVPCCRSPRVKNRNARSQRGERTWSHTADVI